MQDILAVTFPFFVLVLLGYVAARLGALPESAIPGLNVFVLYFALPCMLFRFGIGTPIGQLLDLPLMAMYAACALAMVGGTILFTLGGVIGIKDAAFGALVAAFPNTGFMGVPLLVALLGPTAAGPAIVTILVDLFLTSSLCIALAQTEGASAEGKRAAFRRAVRGALSNPLPWSIALGAMVALARIELPGPVDRVIALLGDSASPVALFTIGAVLARARSGVHTRTPLALYVPVALVKLVGHPLLVLSVGVTAIGVGWPVSKFSVLVVTLVAALPSASNVSLFAERFGADNGRIARIILLSTALAFGSFSGAVWLLTA